jgi:hypothetical protein
MLKIFEAGVEIVKIRLLVDQIEDLELLPQLHDHILDVIFYFGLEGGKFCILIDESHALSRTLDIVGRLI